MFQLFTSRARWPLTEKRLLFRVSSASVWKILCQQQAADGNLFDLWKEADTVLYWIKLVSVEPWNGPGFLCFGDLIKTELSQIDKALHNCSATTEQPIEVHETATCQPDSESSSRRRYIPRYNLSYGIIAVYGSISRAIWITESFWSVPECGPTATVRLIKSFYK